MLPIWRNISLYSTKKGYETGVELVFGEPPVGDVLIGIHADVLLDWMSARVAEALTWQVRIVDYRYVFVVCHFLGLNLWERLPHITHSSASSLPRQRVRSSSRHS